MVITPSPIVQYRELRVGSEAGFNLTIGEWFAVAI